MNEALAARLRAALAGRKQVSDARALKRWIAFADKYVGTLPRKKA